MAKANYEPQDDEAADLGPDPRKVGAGLVSAGYLIAAMWLISAAAFVYLVVGVEALRAAEPIALIGGAMLGLLPAALIVFAAHAAREGARGRAEAARLAEAAQRLFNPAPSAEAAARRLGVSVRGEIAALDRALDQVMQKLRETEAVIARQTLGVDNAASAAQAGARQMVAGLERERNELLQIADDLANQAGLIGDSITRHTRMIADAARLAETEVRAADEALEARLSSFGAAAALISDRTQALTGAAQTSAESALRLENALSGALDALAKATTLTDAARQSSEAATLAANATAGAVRETTLRAVEDAKRAAELIRNEAAQIERDGEAALVRLRDAAEQARLAAEHARIASGAPAPQAAAPVRKQAAQPFLGAPRRDAPKPEPQPLQMREPAAPSLQTPRPGDPGYADSLSAPPPRAPQPAPPRPQAPPPAAPAGGGQDRWTWRDVLASIDDEDATAPTPQPAPAPLRDSRAPLDRADPYQDKRARPFAAERREPEPARPETARPRPTLPSSAPGASLIEAAGVRLGEVFSLAALDRISQKARGGTQARRRAVREAAPDAVLRLATHLDQSAEARAEAANFLRSDGARISELLGRGRASMSADATRAFLLIDAAS